MKFSRILILIGAAAAGTLVYKAQTVVTAPGTSNPPGSNIYTSLTGQGSLGATVRNASNERDQAMQNGGQPVIDPNRQTGHFGKFNFNNTGGYTGNLGVRDDLALIQAASKGDKDRVERRLAAHVKVDSRDTERRTPLMYACWNGYDDIALRLLAAGANPTFKDKSGNNAFDYSAGRGLTDNLRLLLTRTGTPDDNHYVEYARIIQAVFTGDESRLPEGKGRLASVNRINPEGEAPLHIAAGNGSIKIIDALLARGGNVNLLNVNNQTPLHWAAWNNQAESARVLLARGADINAVDWNGNSALIMAVQNGSTGVAKLLMDEGANRLVVNREGKNAAIIADELGYKDFARSLQ